MATLYERLLKKAAERAARDGGNTRIPEPRRELTPKEEAELEQWMARVRNQKYAHKD